MAINLNIKIQVIQDDNTVSKTKEFTKLLDEFSDRDMRKLHNLIKIYFDKEELSKEL